MQNIDSGTYYIDKTGKVLFRTDGFWGMIISTFEYGLATKERTNDETGMWDRTYINKNGEEIFSEYYNLTQLWGPCGYVCKFDLGDEDGKESYGIFVNPYYTTSQPEQPEQPIQPATAEANPTNDKLTVNGVEQNPTVYKIGDSNYFKIRDLAAVLNGTGKQFSVGYDAEKQSVTAAPGQPYELTGTERRPAAMPSMSTDSGWRPRSIRSTAATTSSSGTWARPWALRWAGPRNRACSSTQRNNRKIAGETKTVSSAMLYSREKVCSSSQMLWAISSTRSKLTWGL